MLEVLNSSVNFFIYFAYHQYFRSVVASWKLCGSARHRAPPTGGGQGCHGGPSTRNNATSQVDVIRLQELHGGVESPGNQLQQQEQQQNTTSTDSWKSFSVETTSDQRATTYTKVSLSPKSKSQSHLTTQSSNRMSSEYQLDLP